MAEELGGWLAMASDEPLGIMILMDHGFSSVENVLLAIRPEFHRQGIGTMLIQHACAYARSLGKAYLTVKTLGPSRASESYKGTRAFYSAVGFEPLEEIVSIWGPENPCLLMIKAVSR